jgi:peroxin-4
VCSAGEICLDILKDAWTPIWTLESTCRAIIFLLANPAADSPLNCDAGNLVRCGTAPPALFSHVFD